MQTEGGHMRATKALGHIQLVHTVRTAELPHSSGSGHFSRVGATHGVTR